MQTSGSQGISREKAGRAQAGLIEKMPGGTRKQTVITEKGKREKGTSALTSSCLSDETSRERISSCDYINLKNFL